MFWAVGVSAGKLLPRVGAWMEKVKAVFGVLTLGLAIWLLERLLPAPVTVLLWGLLLSGSAIYLGALAFIEAPIIICDLVASDEPVDHRRAALTIQEGLQPAEMRASWPVKPRKTLTDGLSLIAETRRSTGPAICTCLPALMQPIAYSRGSPDLRR